MQSVALTVFLFGEGEPMLSFDPAKIPAENHPKYPVWIYVAPLLSAELMGTVGASDIENFFVVGDAWAQVITRFLGASDTVLDIGCGCGRTARFLLNLRSIQYIGFDIFKPSIEWCIANLTPLSNNRFRFYHFDGFSQHYNPQGKISVSQYRFPADSGSIDVAFGASIFTHLRKSDAEHYLEETYRVLKKEGKAVFSIHVNPTVGQLFSGSEDRIDIDPGYFISMAERAQLKLKERIGDLCGQQTFMFEKSSFKKYHSFFFK